MGSKVTPLLYKSNLHPTENGTVDTVGTLPFKKDGVKKKMIRRKCSSDDENLISLDSYRYILLFYRNF
jgi:hypothetical protein